ncbi:MAG: AI-2E family transporter, partial [Desulfovibrionaceae bacterium]
MLFDDKPWTLDRVVRTALAAGLLWAVVSLLGYLNDVLLPFAVALLLAYLINPLVGVVQKKITNRGLAVAATLLGLLLAGAGLLILVLPMIGQEFSHMGQVISRMVTDSKLAERASERLPPDLWAWLKETASREQVQGFFASQDFAAMAQQGLKRLLPGAWGVLSGTLDVLLAVFGLAVILLYMIFLLLDFKRIESRWGELLPANAREQVRGFFAEFEAAMSRYFRAQFVVAMLTGVLFAVGFSIIGLPLAILMGLAIGVMNMVPYLQLVGLIPAGLLAMFHALETGQSFWVTILLVLLVAAVAQAIQDGFLVPKIMGQAMGLSPWLILLSLSIWGKLLGLFGLLIALPATCLVLAWYRRYLSTGHLDFRPL